MPVRDLTRAEIETIMKQDVLPQVILRRCGQRLLAWYGELRKGWK